MYVPNLHTTLIVSYKPCTRGMQMSRSTLNRYGTNAESRRTQQLKIRNHAAMRWSSFYRFKPSNSRLPCALKIALYTCTIQFGTTKCLDQSFAESVRDEKSRLLAPQERPATMSPTGFFISYAKWNSIRWLTVCRWQGQHNCSMGGEDAKEGSTRQKNARP